MRAGRKDLRDFPFDELAGARVFHLIANGDFASAFQDARDVIIRRMKRQAAHRHAVARGEREIDQLRTGLRVLEKQFLKVAEAEEQQCVLRQFAFDAAILRHHGSELRFGGHGADTLGGKFHEVEMKLLTSADSIHHRREAQAARADAKLLEHKFLHHGFVNQNAGQNHVGAQFRQAGNFLALRQWQTP